MRQVTRLGIWRWRWRRPATAIATETPGASIFQPMQRNEHGKQRRIYQAPAASSHWRTGMERIIRQQEQYLKQLHRTFGHLAHLVEAWAARKEAQRLAMMMWMQERAQKWHARYEDDNVWGAGIMIMIAQTMNGEARAQQERERESQVTVRMDGGVLQASQHPHTTREEGPEESQQPQQQLKTKPKLQLKLQLKLKPVPK